jgi:L-threonylcarbamoyladenylate synthase
MRITKLSKNNYSAIVLQAVKVLKAGGLVIYPTETCYGAGVDATNLKAVDKLLAYKTRREGKPLSIAVSSQSMASNYVKLNTSAINLYQKFLPGPLTVISKGINKVTLGVQSETNTLGIRIPDYPLVINMVKKLQKPITATSANVSYKKRPYSIKDILNNTSKKQQNLIDLIIDAGTLPKRPASTIIDTTLDDLLLRGKGFGTPRASSEPKKVVSHSPQQTINLAKTIMLKNVVSLTTRPLVFLLIGDLGAGKTQFAKGIGQFLKIKQPITSPTYTIEKEYPYTRHSIKGLFIHLDTWRLQNIEELKELKLETRLKPKNVIAIEWADRTQNPILKLAKQANAKIIQIIFKSSRQSPSQRQLTILAN